MTTEVPHVSSLDPESLPLESLHKYWVDLTHDGFGRPVSVPVIVAVGSRPGPIFGLTAALHGNELNGIPVIHSLLERISLKTLTGTIIAVVVANPLSFERGIREFPDGTDLNHIMPGRESGKDSEVFVYRLVNRVIKHFDVLVDLHTASFGRVNSLYVRADMTRMRTASMAYLQKPQIIVHNKPSDGTLRGEAEELGIPSITVEIGDPHRFQPEYIKRSVAGLRRVLFHLGMLPTRKPIEAPQPIICASSKWLYADTGGLLEVTPRVYDILEDAQPYATIRDAFGQITRLFESPHRGIVIGKSVNPVARTGSRLIHLGHIADDNSVKLVKREEIVDSLAPNF